MPAALSGLLIMKQGHPLHVIYFAGLNYSGNYSGKSASTLIE
jgi:hypothetical protein